jgi:CRP-like cAMP-binding protein
LYLSFYINLRGKVSIYINHRKHDELDNLDENVEASPEDITDQHYSEILNLPGRNEKRSKKIREKLGNYVTSLGAGEGFGEIALVSDDTRTASIIADEETDLMVVNKILYARYLS